MSKVNQPPLPQRPLKEFVAIMLGGSLLAFSSGLLNATTVASERQMTSQPMTGTSTMIGISVADGDSSVFGDKIGILLFHILVMLIFVLYHLNQGIMNKLDINSNSYN